MGKPVPSGQTSDPDLTFHSPRIFLVLGYLLVDQLVLYWNGLKETSDVQRRLLCLTITHCPVA